DFTGGDFMVGGSIIISGEDGGGQEESASIAEIIGPTEIRLKKAFERRGFRDSGFKVAPHIDQSRMFEAVFEELSGGGCVGIFPEGGSHDRSNLLPLKAGAAIMALGAVSRDPSCR